VLEADQSVKTKTKITVCQITLSTRNSSGDEIVNVNFLYDDKVHALRNTTD